MPSSKYSEFSLIKFLKNFSDCLIRSFLTLCLVSMVKLASLTFWSKISSCSILSWSKTWFLYSLYLSLSTVYLLRIGSFSSYFSILEDRLLSLIMLQEVISGSALKFILSISLISLFLSKSEVGTLNDAADKFLPSYLLDILLLSDL